MSDGANNGLDNIWKMFICLAMAGAIVLSIALFGWNVTATAVLVLGGLNLLFVAIYLPITLRKHREREEKLRSGAVLCAKCGYDVRATPGQCPECGTALPFPRAARRRKKLRERGLNR